MPSKTGKRADDVRVPTFCFCLVRAIGVQTLRGSAYVRHPVQLSDIARPSLVRDSAQRERSQVPVNSNMCKQSLQLPRMGCRGPMDLAHSMQDACRPRDADAGRARRVIVV